MSAQEIVISLNDSFSNDVPAKSLVGKIALCANPLVIDFNGTLATQSEPISLRDDALRSLKFMIEKAITPFIITLADDWAGIHESLATGMNSMSDHVVIMTNKSWAPDHPYPPWRKQVRHLFSGTNDIPIIDNDSAAVRDNPGMRGYYVKTFKPESAFLDMLNMYSYQTLWEATITAVSDYVGI